MSLDTVARRQRAIVRVASAVLRPFARFARRITWVVGLEDIAQTTTRLAAALPGSMSVVYGPHPFYAPVYDVIIDRQDRPQHGTRFTLRRLYLTPVLFAWLAVRADGFIYVGAAGFLDTRVDERAWEFAFLRDRGIRVVCYFTGNDIRSPKRMRELEETTGIPNLGARLIALDPVFGSDEYDAQRKRRARAAEQVADVVFTASADQLSYFTGSTEPFMYFYPDEQFLASTSKFDDVETVRIVHAPSSPVLKGTSEVRAAMRALSQERDDFEYVELSGVPNEQVIEALDSAHIVLNQFYAHMPGVLGVESLARRCVLVTSADERVEPDLPAGANDAWVVTGPDEIQDRVRSLLDHKDQLAAQADAGWRWAKAHASAAANSAQLRRILGESERR